VIIQCLDKVAARAARQTILCEAVLNIREAARFVNNLVVSLLDIILEIRPREAKCPEEVVETEFARCGHCGL
jgi:hypothetical protein